MLEASAEQIATLNLRDVEFTATRGSGAGGQHRNKTSSCVIAVHKPSGERVRVETERSQHRNKQTAIALLSARLAAHAETAQAGNVNRKRKQQIGGGARGDKVRTYRVRDDRVKDHRTGQTWRLSRWMDGRW